MTRARLGRREERPASFGEPYGVAPERISRASFHAGEAPRGCYLRALNGRRDHQPSAPNGGPGPRALGRPGAARRLAARAGGAQPRVYEPAASRHRPALRRLFAGQMARRYRLPWRSSGMNTGSKLVDAQAAYESTMTMYSVLLAGANFVLHAAGWLEGGLCASFAKFVLDEEQMAMYYKFAQGVDLDDLDGAMAAVREVGPGGHYLGAAHTRENFESAFFMPELLDNNSFEQWEIEGSKDANSRAIDRVRDMLARYEAPEIDPAVDEELLAFMARRRDELPTTVS